MSFRNSNSSKETERFIEDNEFSVEKLNNYILTGYQKMQAQIKGKKIVLVIGCTGSGKSTLINYLLSNNILFEKKSMKTVAKAEKTGEKFPEIGHEDESKTLFPEVYTDTKSGLSYCDFPGFFDNRPFEEKVSISVNCESAITNATVQAIIVVLSYSEFDAQRGKLFRSLNQLLQSFICDVESILPNIIFVLSKPSEDITHDNFYEYVNERVNSSRLKIQNTFNNLKNMVKKKIDLNAKNQESEYKFLSMIIQKKENFVVGNLKNNQCRKKIEHLIKSLTEDKIAEENFNFNHYDVDRIKLNDVIAFFAFHGLSNIRSYFNNFKVC